MINFNLIDIVDSEIKGEGYYQKLMDGLFIQAIDHELLSEFKKMSNDKKIIKSLHFKGKKADGAFSGPFMIKQISGNDIYLKKI